MIPKCECRNHNIYLKKVYKTADNNFYKCCECGVYVRNPLPSLDELDRIYEELYAEEQIIDKLTTQESGFAVLDKYVNYLLKNIIKANDKILDYGCGTGYLTRQMRSRGISAYGLERSSDARKYALKIGIELYSNLVNVGNKEYDCITLIEVIEHLLDPLEILKEINSKLTENGKIFITTPNVNGLRARIERAHWREIEKKFHVVMFTEKSLRAYLKSAGFVNVKRVKYPPVQRSGYLRNILTRLQQFVGIGGTLVMMANKGEHV